MLTLLTYIQSMPKSHPTKRFNELWTYLSTPTTQVTISQIITFCKKHPHGLSTRDLRSDPLSLITATKQQTQKKVTPLSPTSCLERTDSELAQVTTKKSRAGFLRARRKESGRETLSQGKRFTNTKRAIPLSRLSVPCYKFINSLGLRWRWGDATRPVINSFCTNGVVMVREKCGTTLHRQTKLGDKKEEVGEQFANVANWGKKYTLTLHHR